YFRAADAKTDAQKARERAKDDVIVFDEDFQQFHLWKITVATKTTERVTSGPFSILSYQLSRDGKKIACVRGPSPLITDNESSEVWVMDANGSNARQVTQNHVPETAAALSPDGSQVLFLAEANQAFDSYYNRKLFVAPVGGGAARLVMGDLPYEIDAAA